MDDLVERWPGYAYQSWAERFAELDRRNDQSSKANLAMVLAMAAEIAAQAAEIRSLRAQVEQERAGIVAMTRRWAEARWEEFQSFPNPSSPVAAAVFARVNILRRIAAAIEIHEDKEPRA